MAIGGARAAVVRPRAARAQRRAGAGPSASLVGEVVKTVRELVPALVTDVEAGTDLTFARYDLDLSQRTFDRVGRGGVHTLRGSRSSFR